MAGDMTPAAGSMTLDGAAVHSIPRRQRARQIAYVPPTLEWPTAMTVREFVALGRTPYVQGWARFSAADEAAVQRALRMTDLETLTDRSMLALSEGERHRALIALGLAQEPATLLLDEPTAHLDIKHAWELMGLIEELHRSGLTIVMATHDLNIAAAFCQRLLLLVESKSLAQGTPAEVLTREQLTQAYQYPIEIDSASERIKITPGRRHATP
jgi:iron complex transport system ATP-binding protein